MTTPNAGSVEVDVVADASQFDSSLRGRIRNAMGGAERQARDGGKRFGRAFTKEAGTAGQAIRRLGAVAAAAFAGKQVVDGIRGVIGAASDYEESISKVRAVFGPASKQVEAFAATSAQSLGISRNAALEAVGTYGNLLTALGVNKTAAQSMSTEFVKLAADLASFNNSTPEEALAALRSGLTGETEPLKRYGVALNDAAIRQEAVRLGLIKTVKGALTPAAKAQAVYAVVMRSTKTAQGDVARTSSGLANTTRRLQAKFNDLKADLGRGILPIVLRVATAFEGLGKRGGGLRRALQPVVDVVKAIMLGINPLGPAVGDSIGGETRNTLIRFGATLRTIAGQVKAFITAVIIPAFRAIAPVVVRVAKIALRMLASIVAALARLGEFVQRNGTVFRTLAVAVLGGIAAFKAYRAILAIIRTSLLAVRVAAFLTAGGIRAVGLAIRANPIGTLVTVIGALAAGFIYAWKNSERFRTIVLGVIKFVGNAALTLVDKFLEGLAQIFGVLGKLPGKFGEPFRKAEKSVNGARDRVRNLKDELNTLSANPIKVDVRVVKREVQQRIAETNDRKGRNIGGVRVVGATGGIVRRPTVALIGEAGPEAVVPLNKTPGNGPLPNGLGGVTQQFYISEGMDADAVQRQAAFRFRTQAVMS